jgi:hypothetical protein
MGVENLIKSSVHMNDALSFAVLSIHLATGIGIALVLQRHC